MPLINLKKLIRYYYIKVICDNCKWKQDLRIPKGETIEDYMKRGECEHCGCNKLRQINALD